MSGLESQMPPQLSPKKAERVGIEVATRLALVQADIWAKRGAASDIYELEPLFAVEETCTRTAIGKLVDELAQQGLQRVPRQQTIQFLKTNSLCLAATCSRSRIPIQRQEKRAQREF